MKKSWYVLSDYDRWFKPCENCGYDTAKASKTSKAICWKCGRKISIDYSSRALKLGQLHRGKAND